MRIRRCLFLRALFGLAPRALAQEVADEAERFLGSTGVAYPESP
jgi:hypothetical protein